MQEIDSKNLSKTEKNYYFLLLGELNLSSGNLQESLIFFQQSAEISKNNRNILGISRASSRLNIENPASSKFRRIGFVQAKFVLVYHLLRKNDFEKALWVVNGILKVKPKNIWAFFYRGIIKVLLNAVNLAALDFQRCLKLQKIVSTATFPDAGIIHFNKAVITK